MAMRFMEEGPARPGNGEVYESESDYIDNYTGERRWVSGFNVPCTIRPGRIGDRQFSTYHDIKRAEIEREKLIIELEAKNTELERFTYTFP